MAYRSQMIKKIADNLSESSSPVMRTKLYSKAARLGSLLTQYEATIETKHPSDSPAAHAKRLVDNGKLFKDQVNSQTTAMLNTISDGISELRRTAMKKAKLDHSQDAQEIRRITRGMTSSEHLKLLEKKDPFIVAALIDTNSFLHGIDEKVLSGFVEVMLKDAAPDEMNEIEQLTEFIPTVQIITREASKTVSEAVDNEYIQTQLNKAKADQDTHDRFISEVSRGTLQ